MKKIISWLLVVALTAAIAVGGTMAYLTDTDQDVNVMTVGKVKIDQLEYERKDVETKDENAIVQEFHDNKALYPAVTDEEFNWETNSTVDWAQIGKDGYTSGIWDPEKINNEQDKMVFVKNKGDYDAYVRSVFAFEANGYTLDQFKAMFHLNINETDWTWAWEETPVAIPGEDGVTTNYIIATATYNKALEPGELTEISLSQIALDPSAGNAVVTGLGDTYQLLVKTQAVQTEGFADADSALNEAFGEITAENVPFETDSSTRGINLRTALHNLDGDSANVITGKISKIVFAKKSEYPAIVDGYKGTLVDAEQNVDVYAYYVPNDSNYDVYFLASDKIMIPRNCSGLFRDMRSLQSVDTHNADFSLAEDMTYMFRDCRVLTQIDTSAWNIKNATNMKGMFQNCYVLPALEVSAWDTRNVTDLSFMFSSCKKLKTINGTENWDTGNVTNLRQTFAFCNALEALNLRGWDTSDVTDMMGTFGECHAMTALDVTGWDTSKTTSTQNMFFNDYDLPAVTGIEGFVLSSNLNSSFMFQNCETLKELDVSKWDMGKVTNFRGTFYHCFTIETIKGLENWNTGSGTTFKSMFENCENLSGIDISTWDTGSLTDMDHMFYNCFSIETLDLGNWDTKNVTTTRSMFSGTNHVGNMKLRQLDVSNWDTSSLTDISFMFYGCNQLVELDLSSWDTSNVTQMSTVFNFCHGLTTIYASERWSVENVVRHDDLFSNCENLTGGAGTKHSSAHTGKEYAHIDSVDNPGYLTYKAPAANP